MWIHLQQGTDARQYNLPTVDEIAAIIPEDGSNPNVKTHHDIVVCLQDGGLHQISNLHPSYLPLHYVLLFSHGEEGWHLDIPSQNANGNSLCFKKVTQLLWYAYRLHVHPPQIEPQNHFKGISAILLGLPTIKQNLELIYIRGCKITWVMMMLVRIWVKLDVSFCLLVTKVELGICNSFFRTPWPFVMNIESLIYFSP